MRLERFQESEDTPFFPLTALVDVLFFTIIFLVLGASFDAVDTTRLPQATGQPGPAVAALEVELRADGSLTWQGRLLPADEAVPILAARHPQSILLLPDSHADVGSLFRWYGRLGQGLHVPVQVGVRAAPP